MKQYLILLVAIFTISSTLQAGENDVLFKIDGDPVTVAEFEYIYNKNNFNNKADYSEASIKEYLDLYINFRLKVKEAEALGLDKDAKLQSELKVYQKQLYNSFFDREHLKTLVDEAMERSLSDVSVAHIFVGVNPEQDEKAAKAKLAVIQEAYQALENGKSFEEVAKKYSEDKYTKNDGGRLAYYTALQIAYYPLENAAYQTPVGQYSQPIRTTLGYHIVKVDDKRPARGKAKASVIKLMKKGKSGLNSAQVKEVAQMIYDQLSEGADFNEYVLKYSEDKLTKDKGGQIDWFGIAQYDRRFEDAVFSLKNKGDYTPPFETEDAWYVVRLDDLKPVTTTDEDRDLITKKVQQGDRYKLIYDKHVASILNKYGFEKNQPEFDAFKTAYISAGDQIQKFFASIKEPVAIAKIVGQDCTDLDFSQFIKENNFRHRRLAAEARVEVLFEEYKKAKAIDFHIIEYGKENPEYGALLNEYRDGILLFELMETNVWSKAVRDTAGLKDFFQNNRENFKNPEKAITNVFRPGSTKEAAFLIKALKSDPGLSNVSWLSKLNKKGISTNSDQLEIFKTDALASTIAWKKGLNSVSNDEGILVYQVVEIKPESTRNFEDSKGFAIAEYQEYLEDQWIEVLREKYEIKINDAVLKSLVKN